MKQYFLSLITIGSMLLVACQKRTQIIDIEPTFLKKTVTYDVTVMDTITHKDNGTLSYVRPFLLPDLAKRRTFYTPSYEAEELQI